MDAADTTIIFERVKQRIGGYEGIYRIPSEAKLTFERVTLADLDVPATFRGWNVQLGMPDEAWGRLAGGKSASYMRRLAEAITSGKSLAPLVLVKAHNDDAQPCDGAYHIDDGHHRVALALALGIEALDAYVFDRREHRPTRRERDWLVYCYRLGGGKAGVHPGQLPDEDNMWIRQLAAHDTAVERYDATH